jgi:putative chitinase
MSIVDGDVLRDIAPQVGGSKGANQARIIGALGEVIGPTLDKYQINTRLRDAHFLAQTCEESDGFCTTEEYASGAAYEGRKDLGNSQKGDGRLFKGRGLLQLTGRGNYASYGPALGLDLVANPALAAEPVNSLLIACEFWKRHNLNSLADGDNLIAITRTINGGQNGIDMRRAYLTKAKASLARLAAAAISTPDPWRRRYCGAARKAMRLRSFRRVCKSPAIPWRSTAISVRRRSSRQFTFRQIYI